MKKIITFFAAIFLVGSMMASNIEITVSSIETPGAQIWTDKVATDGWWQIDGTTADGTYHFSISNTSTTEPAGNYVIGDLDPDYTYVFVNENKVAFTDGSVTVAIAEGVITVNGTLVGDDGNDYVFALTYKDPVAENTVNIEITKWILSDYISIYGAFMVIGESVKGERVQLYFWSTTVAGNYNEKDFYHNGGIKIGEEWQRIFSATVKVEENEGDVIVTADILCYNNTQCKVTTKVERTFVDFKIEFRENPFTVLVPQSGELPAGVSVDGTAYNGGQHGVQGGIITVPVDGPVKFTIGTCNYSETDIIVKKDGEAFTTISNNGACGETAGNYAQNITYVYVGDAATLTFELGNQTYMPYFFAEATEFVAATGVSLDQSEVALTVGETLTLTATIEPADATDKTVTWTTSDASVATVSTDGVVTAVAVGTATITATATNGTADDTTDDFAAPCIVTVNAPANLGAKTIAEFLDLKNAVDTCVLTGVVTSITNTAYGNLYLADETGTLYVYGVLTPAGEAKKFESLGVEVNDTLTIKAIYSEYQGNPRVQNAVFVDVKKYVEPATTYSLDITPAEHADYTVTVGGEIVGDEVELKEGDEVVITATPEQGYEYATAPEGWTKLLDGTGITATFTVSGADLTINIPEPKVKSAGIEDLQSDKAAGSKAQKVLIDGVMYIILPDGSVISGSGARVK